MISRCCGLSTELMESPSDRGCIGTMPPAFANTGIPSSGRQTVMRRPLGEDALYRRPVKKSNQSPCGSHTSALPRREDLSIGSVLGAASSSVPNMYSLGTWYAASMSGDPQYMGSTRGRPVRDARQFMVWRYGIMRWRRRSASSMIARRGCGCFFGRSGGQSKTSAVLHGAHPVQ